ncbi:MAG: FmdB family zinc ribbon protein [Solirubrobacteraceae bacterium]
MPIYEYKCDAGHVFEVIQSFRDEPLVSCEVCGAPVQKVLYPAAIHFKGSGFYNTDYKTRRRAREAKENRESSAPVAGSSDSPGSSGSNSGNSASSSDSGGSSGSNQGVGTNSSSSKLASSGQASSRAA